MGMNKRKGSQEKKLTLQKLQEILEKAKDEAVQSWLDSRPVIDELEKYNQNLQMQRASQHEILSISIRAKEEELKIQRIINRVNQVLQKTQGEMKQLTMERKENHGAEVETKTSLTATEADSSNFATYPASNTVRVRCLHCISCYIDLSQNNNTMFKLTQEEYDALTKRAVEQTTQAEWRISISMEQKEVAEKSQDLAARRLKNLYSNMGSRKRKHQADGLGNQNIEEEELHPNVSARSQAINGQNSFPKTHAHLPTTSPARRNHEKFKN
ncbi:hypothetical protein ACH5RR_011412 [Cinchona calisaya]|uniref:Uncharacterized protein n=1 Tax=Cinchona calisaya TaxID=153742 RepID=A0ABD3A4U2_9GENT